LEFAGQGIVDLVGLLQIGQRDLHAHRLEPAWRYSAA